VASLPFDDDLDVPGPRFDGPAYEAKHDQVRLSGQLARIYNCMRDGEWRTLGEIQAATRDPQASISAQLRHLRKPRFGAHQVDRRTRGDRAAGLYEYRLVVSSEAGK
jgi:hypothetical protein